MDILNEYEVKKHINFINKKFFIACHNIFTEDEEFVLIQYGEWMSALEKRNFKTNNNCTETFY